MAIRIEITTKNSDTRASVRRKKFHSITTSAITDCFIVDVYTIDKKLNQNQLETIAQHLSNPLTQICSIKGKVKASREKSKQNTNLHFSYAIEIGFLPGVTDNIATTTKEIIQDLLKVTFDEKENVYTSQITFINGKLSKSDIHEIASSLYNPVIQRMHLKSFTEFKREGGMDSIVPKVKLNKEPIVSLVNLDVPDVELTKIGKSGIANPDGTRRGPLALDLTYMKTIQNYFKKLGRKPTDIEIESLAQTWSEHCKHTIFADPIDDIQDGLYKTYIKRATEEIRKKKGKNDFCVSVFTDNSGAIVYDDEYLITHKVETHNSPSALDPFGGSITGIVGVNRDAIGFGLGAKPVANFYGYCFSDPRINSPLYRGEKKTSPMLSARRIMDGVIDGVNAGGNQSGIPTPQGFVYFDERYRGKPLVFVGTLGLIPQKIKGKLSYVKKAQPDDYIVVVGGRVGKDGIHGATFSSVGLDEGSPSTAVQIGDPITQKKLSDAIVKEARDLLLYNSITDNGAGGISCSVAEMAKESGGCDVQLEKVPLKYPGLEPWEIWISESQERMTLAVPPNKWEQFSNLMQSRGVEATIIGTFTKKGKCHVTYNKKTIIDIDMKFLHDGLPQRPMTTKAPLLYTSSEQSESRSSSRQARTIYNLNKSLLQMLNRLNITSYEFISQQYDSIVQGNAVLGPLQGRGRVNGETTVFRPVLSSQKGVMLSQSLYPYYSEINPYDMSECTIDTAIRNLVTTGANPQSIALLDNFCWCSSTDPERLWQLKQAAKACYETAIAYETPFISGKDSMFNDFKGFDKKGKPIKISIPPTLLISSISVCEDITKLVTLDAKMPGDLVYLLGETYEELGGSEYSSMINVLETNVPKVNTVKNKKIYESLAKAINKKLVASSISLTRGGLAVALAKKTIGGQLGMDITLKNINGNISSDDFALYSESQGRILVTIDKKEKIAFEKIMNGIAFKQIGKVTKEKKFVVKGLKGNEIIHLDVNKMTNAYRETFKNY
jgi:phosphoribosylformylglycinamidine synthase subunit PurSL